MARLSRADSQARTQQQLLEVATELFLKDGYRATSLAAVAERAGFSTGAVYSNFGGKSDLGLAVLDRLRGNALQELAVAFADDDRSLDARVDTLLDWAEVTLGDAEWPRMELEFALEARGDASRVEQLASRQRAIQDGLTELLGGLETSGVTPLLPPRHLARLLISITVGHSMQRMVDPQVTPGSLRRAVRALLAPQPDPDR